MLVPIGGFGLRQSDLDAVEIPELMYVTGEIEAHELIREDNGIPRETSVKIPIGTTLTVAKHGMFSTIGEADSVVLESIDGRTFWISKTDLTELYDTNKLKSERRNLNGRNSLQLKRAIEIEDAIDDIRMENGNFFTRLIGKHQRWVKDEIKKIFRCSDDPKEIMNLCRRMACLLVNDRKDPHQRQNREKRMKDLILWVSKNVNQ